MSSTDRQAQLQELESLRERVRQLESELAQDQRPETPQFYTSYYATTGFMLGLFGALTSLTFNIVGSLLVGNHPLRLIQVYLTFPLGDKVLNPDMNWDLTLAAGCCLYLGTGMMLGIPFQVILARFVRDGNLMTRLAVATVISIAIWLINFYAILAWLQPLLFGGNWIVELVPWWVAMLTHLIFGWTMALVYPWGEHTPYRPQSELQ